MTTTAQWHLLLTMAAHESLGSARKTTSSSRLAEASARI